MSDVVATTSGEMDAYAPAGMSTKHPDDFGGGLLKKYGAQSAPRITNEFPGYQFKRRGSPWNSFIIMMVVIIGSGSRQGSVIASRNWGAPMQKIEVPPAIENSIEEILHHESAEDKMLLLNHARLKEKFNRWLPHRAIGVVFRPQAARGNYVPTLLPARYDGFLLLDKTTALHPFDVTADKHQIPETYPFGFQKCRHKNYSKD